MPTLSSGASVPRPSPTLAISAKAAALKAKGVEVFNFSVGEPDFNTPKVIRDATIAALDSGHTKYTSSSGILALREAIAAKLDRENGLQYDPDQIVATVGAKHAVFNALWAILSPGDEAILIAPYWMTYRDQIALCGANPVVISTSAEDGFVPTLDQIRNAITPRTKAIVLNSPANPTGAMLPRDLVEGIAELACQFDFWIVSDEIYERLVYDDEESLSPASLSPEVYARTITVNGFSKTFSMTGWRLGYLAAPVEIAEATRNFQDSITSNPTSFVQYGALRALSLDPSEIESMRLEFERRRDFAYEKIMKIPGFRTILPKGAFYFFIDIREVLSNQFANDCAFCDHLLETQNVATIPGSVFEGPGHLRLSYANSIEVLEEGIARIARALQHP